MIKRMQKVSFRGPLNHLREVIEELKASGAFELSTFAKKGKTEGEENTQLENYNTLLARISAVLEFSRNSETGFASAVKHFGKKFPTDKTFENKAVNKGGHNKVEELTYEELKAMAQHELKVMSLVDKLEELSVRSNEIKATINKNKETINSLTPFIELETPFGQLRDTKNAFVWYGIMPAEYLEKFTEDFDLSNIVVSQFPTKGGDVGIVLIGHKDELPIIESISNYQFTRFEFDFEPNAAEQIRILQDQTIQLERDFVQNMFDSALPAADISLLKQYHDYAENELDTESILAQAIKTKDNYVLNGWVPEGEKKKVLALIQKISPQTKCKFGRTVTIDIPPVHVVSHKIVEPYQSITNMYGAPGKKDIDPNPFVAFFYFLFFGMMVGDLGYGLVMLALSAVIFLWIKPRSKGVRQLFFVVLLMGGISTVLWGLFFGGVFGFSLGFGAINPIDDAIILLGLAMGLGVLHLMAGIALKGWNMIRQGRYLDAVLDSFSHLVMFVGIILVVGDMMLFDVEGLGTAGFAILGTALAIIVLTNGRKAKTIMGKIIGGFSGGYSLVGYFSDVLSYARLFGLALVGAVIAMVANIMGGLFTGMWFTWPIAIVIAVAFHTFNLGLACLSAYIHNSRLQFIEFFGKFYEGNGTIFMPIGSQLQYVKIKSSLLGVA